MVLKLLPASTRSDCELYDRQTDRQTVYLLTDFQQTLLEKLILT